MTPEQLKESILQYAMEGKLVSQDPNDEPASVLLEKARNELDEAVRKKRIRKEKYNRAVKPENYPTNWEVTRLIEICAKVKGAIKRGPFGSSITKAMFVPKSKNTFKVYEQGNAIRKTTDYGEYYMPDSEFERLKSFEVHAGDIIISCAGTIGEAFVIPKTFERGIINQALMKLTIDENIIDKQFFLLVFKSITGQLREHSKGSAIKNLASLKYLKNEVTFPLPPLAEQKRIVERLDQIMPLVDKYAEAYNRLQEIDKGIGDRLKKSLLQYAMEGKLTEQLPEDGDTRDLLAQIKAEKERLIKEKKIKKKKPLEPISEDEVPFDVPENWKWVRLGNIVSLLIGKTPPRADPTRWGKDIPWISIADMKANSTINHTKEMISKESFNENFKSRLSPKGTLIMSFKLTIGRVSFLGMDAVHNEAIVSVFPIYDQNEFLKKYLFKILPYVSQNGDYNNAIKGKTLNSKSLERLLVPLPPLAEQHRIVKKLDELLPLCEELKEDDACG